MKGVLLTCSKCVMYVTGIHLYTQEGVEKLSRYSRRNGDKAYIIIPHCRCSSRQCSGSVTFWYGSGSADPYFWLADPDPAFFVSDLQKVIKKSQNRRYQGFSYYFWLMMEGSGSVILTNGSGRPKKLRIRIWNTGTNVYNTVKVCVDGRNTVGRFPWQKRKMHFF